MAKLRNLTREESYASPGLANPYSEENQIAVGSTYEVVAGVFDVCDGYRVNVTTYFPEVQEVMSDEMSKEDSYRIAEEIATLLDEGSSFEEVVRKINLK